MKYGFVVPMDGWTKIGQFAREAEEAGWDGIFVAEAMWGVDAWISLTMAASQTEHIHLGTMLTPISTMRPWKLASEIATLDHYSNGRVILTIGMGAPDTGFANYGEETELRIRAELVDESLDIITKLQSGQPFLYQGTHYRVNLSDKDAWKPPLPKQSPFPIWAVGAWPRPKSMARTLRCGGIVPAVKHANKSGHQFTTPDDIREIKAWIEARRTAATPFDIVIEGVSPGDDHSQANDLMHSWADAGATWWVESMWEVNPTSKWWNRMRQGPPSV